MRARAFAKINLSLRVVGTRADGYHELQTVFQSIALHDVVTVARTRRPFAFRCDDPACPSDAGNLVWRAAEAMWGAARQPGKLRGVAVHLAKRIPIQAGLGGGSSDAVAAIRLLGRMWRIAASDQRRIAATLGADLPYFFEGGTAKGFDRGDRIEPLPDRERAWVVLVMPQFGVSTRDAFVWWDEDRAARRSRRAAANDLEGPVARRHPEIARAVRMLKRAGAGQASMTGSGSTVFGLFSRQNTALDAASALFGSGYRTVVTRTIGRRIFQHHLAAK
jgi:4-diphosphocytidyl-2-C-methyl-D-erythritol kinase